jgi:hypothetical protein
MISEDVKEGAAGTAAISGNSTTARTGKLYGGAIELLNVDAMSGNR